jgi:hypothetical protein
MDSTFWVFVAFVPFFLFIFLNGRDRSCPECGGPLPVLQSPLTKTKRQWVEGGYLCPRCGCESDIAGARVAPGTGYSRGALLRGIALIAAAGLPAAALITLLLWRHV